MGWPRLIGSGRSISFICSVSIAFLPFLCRLWLKSTKAAESAIIMHGPAARIRFDCDQEQPAYDQHQMLYPMSELKNDLRYIVIEDKISIIENTL